MGKNRKYNCLVEADTPKNPPTMNPNKINNMDRLYFAAILFI